MVQNKLSRKIQTAFLAFSLICGFATAQDAKAAADALLRDVPTSTPQLMKQTYDKYAAQAPQLVKELATRLKPEKGDEDTTSRFAIHRLAWHVDKYGDKSASKAVGKSMLEAMPEANGNMSKLFLLEQLQYTSDPAFADEIAKFLVQEPLAHQALRTLIVTAPPDLDKHLLDALPKVDKRTQVGILQALGKLKPEKAAEEIAKQAKSNEADVRAAALDALAAIGDPASRTILAVAKDNPEGYYGTQASARYVRYANRLLERGNNELSADICKELINAEQTTLTSNITASALEILVKVDGPAALDDLTKAADSDIEEIRMPAMRLAARIKGGKGIDALIEKVKSAPAPEVVADALIVLGESRDKKALPAVLEALKSNESSIRVAAARAAGSIDRAAVLSALVKALSTDDKDLAAAVGEQLARAPQKDLGKLLAEGLDAATTPGKVVLIETLGSRRVMENKAAVYDLTSSQETAVRTAAYKALETLAESGDLPRLLEMMLAAEKSGDRTAARRAFVATARSSEAQKPGELLLQNYKGADQKKKEILLETIAAYSGAGTLDTVVTDATTSGTPELQDAAVRALSDWQTTAAIPALRQLLKSSEEKHQVLAIRGLVRLAEQVKESREKMALLDASMKASKRPDEIKLVIAALSNEQSLRALKLVAAHLNNNDVKAEAAAAAAKIALPSGRRKRGVSGPEVAEILTAALPSITDAKVKENVTKHLKTMQSDLPKKALPKDAEGFSVLFNGKDLDGWVGATDGYAAENGVLVCKKEAGGKLMTEKQFGDFTFQFEFKLEPGANNGVGIRAPLEGDAAYEGMEIQILDDTADAYKNIKPWQVHGSIYGVQPAERAELKKDEWNTEEITAQGNHIKVVVNGKTTVDANLDEVLKSGTADGKSHPGLKRNIGHIGFLGHGHKVEFRNIRVKELANTPPEGFTALFNGKDLTGWKGLAADPKKKLTATPDQLKTLEADAEKLVQEHWKAVDDILVFDGTGPHLCTAKEYKNFEMLADWRILPDGDSGLYLRGVPQVQIWDAEENPVGSGGLYNNQKSTSSPLVVADNPVGQWNRFRIRMEGDKVTVDLNDKRVVDNQALENYWDRDQPLPTSGQIELQTHGTPVFWRNVFIKELP